MQVIQTFIEDPWIEAEEKQTCKWSYPSSDILSKCRLYTFKDLWNNNYYLSEGSKFGGKKQIKKIKLILKQSSSLMHLLFFNFQISIFWLYGMWSFMKMPLQKDKFNYY